MTPPITAPLSDPSSASSSAGGVGAGVADAGGAGGAGAGAGAGAGPGDGPGAGAGAGVGATTTASVTDVTVAGSVTMSFTTTVRPDAASFSTRAAEKADPKLAAFAGSASVSSTAVASARDVVTNSYSTLSFAPCNCLCSAPLNLRLTTSIFVMVTFDASTPKPVAMEPATLLTNVVSAASDAAVTFSGKLPKSKVR